MPLIARLRNAILRWSGCPSIRASMRCEASRDLWPC